jgi:hypothetical protein
MVDDMVLLLSGGYGLSAIFADYPTFSIRIIRFLYLKISPSIRLVPKQPSLYIDYNPTYYIIIACLYLYSSLLVSSYLALAYFYFFTKTQHKIYVSII